ncbi:MAG: AMIN domain-containing protein, partial [Gemmatimonadota bacterium]
MSSLLVAWTSLLLAMPTGEAFVADPGSVTGVQILPASGQTEVVIALEGTVETRDFTMEGPDRIVVDLMGAQLTLPPGMLAGASRGGLQELRASQYSEDVVRIVLELVGPLEYELRSGEGYVRISMTNPLGSFEPWEVDAGGLVAPGSELAGAVATTASPEVLLDTSTVPAAPLLVRQDVAEPITVSFANTPIRDVLFTFSEFAIRSIVPGADVAGVVNAEIRDQPWDI